MPSDIQKFESDALGAIAGAKDKSELEGVENKLLGRKQGEFTSLMKGIS